MGNMTKAQVIAENNLMCKSFAAAEKAWEKAQKPTTSKSKSKKAKGMCMIVRMKVKK